MLPCGLYQKRSATLQTHLKQMNARPITIRQPLPGCRSDAGADAAEPALSVSPPRDAAP
jgi:hypothetical protein